MSITLNNDVLLNILLRADSHTVNNIILSYRYFYDQYNSLWMQKCKQDDLLIINQPTTLKSWVTEYKKIKKSKKLTLIYMTGVTFLSSDFSVI